MKISERLLKKDGIFFVLGHRFTQDALENTFSRIRKKYVKAAMIRASKRAKLTAKKLNYKSDDRIFVGDHLASFASNLLRTAKKLKEEGKILSVWTFNGQVFIRKTEDDRSQRISEEEVLAVFRDVIYEDQSSNTTTKKKSKK